MWHYMISPVPVNRPSIIWEIIKNSEHNLNKIRQTLVFISRHMLYILRLLLLRFSEDILLKLG